MKVTFCIYFCCYVQTYSNFLPKEVDNDMQKTVVAITGASGR